MELQRAIPKHDEDAAKQRGDEEGHKYGAPTGCPQGRGQRRAIGGGVAIALEAFVGKGLHAGDGLQRLRYDRLAVAEAVLGFARKPPQAASEKDRDRDQ